MDKQNTASKAILKNKLKTLKEDSFWCYLLFNNTSWRLPGQHLFDAPYQTQLIRVLANLIAVTNNKS
jgi:hypothetical protein